MGCVSTGTIAPFAKWATHAKSIYKPRMLSNRQTCSASHTALQLAFTSARGTQRHYPRHLMTESNRLHPISKHVRGCIYLSDESTGINHHVSQPQDRQLTDLQLEITLHVNHHAEDPQSKADAVSWTARYLHMDRTPLADSLPVNHVSGMMLNLPASYQRGRTAMRRPPTPQLPTPRGSQL